MKIDPGPDEDIIENMDHFLDMWPFIIWEDSALAMKGEDGHVGVKPLYKTAFSSMYAELYPDHR